MGKLNEPLDVNELLVVFFASLTFDTMFASLGDIRTVRGYFERLGPRLGPQNYKYFVDISNLIETGAGAGFFLNLPIVREIALQPNAFLDTVGRVIFAEVGGDFAVTSKLAQDISKLVHSLTDD